MTAPASPIAKLLRSSPPRAASSRKGGSSPDAGVSFDNTLAQARSKPNSPEAKTHNQSSRPEDDTSKSVKDKPRPDRPASSGSASTDNPPAAAYSNDQNPEKQPTQEASSDQSPPQESAEQPILDASASSAEFEAANENESPRPSAKPGSGLLTSQPRPALSTDSSDGESPNTPPQPEALPKNEKPSVPASKQPLGEELPADSDSAPHPSDETPSTDAAPKTTEPRLPRHLQTKEKENQPEDSEPRQSHTDVFNPTAQPPVASPSPDDATLASALAQTLSDQPHSSSAKPESPALHPTPAPLPQESTPRAESTSPAQETPNSAHENPFEQILLGLRGKFDPKNGRAEIRLDPPSLGTVHVSINLQNGILTAQLQSDSSPVQELLKSNLDQLKNVLESQGVTVDKLVVNNTQEKAALTMTNSSLQTNADGRGSNSQSSDHRRPQPQAEDEFSRIWNELTAAKKPLDLVA